MKGTFDMLRQRFALPLSIVGLATFVLFSLLLCRNGLAEQVVPPDFRQLQAENLAESPMRNASLLLSGITFHLDDANRDGLYEALVAQLHLKLLRPCEYLVQGVLSKNGEAIATQPRLQVAIGTQDAIGGPPGQYTAVLRFSGEQIFRSREDGPYDLEVSAVPSVDSTVSGFLSHVFMTPAYSYTDFGEYRR